MEGPSKIPAESVARDIYWLYASRKVSNVEPAATSLINASDNPAIAAEKTIEMFYIWMKDFTWPTRHDRIAFSRRLALEYSLANSELAERIVADLVSIGWTYEFLETTRALLQRSPYSSEVVAIAKHYCNNLGSRNEKTEELLVEYIENFGDKAAQLEVHAMLVEFQSKWANSID